MEDAVLRRGARVARSPVVGGAAAHGRSRGNAVKAYGLPAFPGSDLPEENRPLVMGTGIGASPPPARAHFCGVVMTLR